MIADQPIVEALIDRALELDESFEGGAIRTFLISYEMVRQGAQSAPEIRARRHFERAMELSDGCSASSLVALAETVCVREHDRSEFERLLNALDDPQPLQASAAELAPFAGAYARPYADVHLGLVGGRVLRRWVVHVRIGG